MVSIKRFTCLFLAGGFALLAIWGVLIGLSQAQTTPLPPISVAVGGSYEGPVLESFAAQATQRDSDDNVVIRVLPIAYPTLYDEENDEYIYDPYTTTQDMRDENLYYAGERAEQLWEACLNIVTDPVTCTVDVVDIQIRPDALDPARVAQLQGEEVDGIFILGGDQTKAMLVVANTPTEDALETLHQNGQVWGGTSAGAAVQARYMLGGYADWAYAWHGLEWGAVELWYGPTESVTRGLRFGLEDAVVDQHFLERGRLLRLLQAAQRKPGSRVGLGIDWGTSVLIHDNQIITGTDGYYAAVVVDEETYGAADGAQYQGPYQALSIHDVAMHVLPEGPYGYDLAQRAPIAQGTLNLPAPDISQRDFSLLHPTSGAGTLFVTGDLWRSPTGTVSARFAQLAQETGKPTLVLAGGFVTGTHALPVADEWAGFLQSLGVTNVQTATLTDQTDLDALAAQLNAAGALFVTGEDQVTLADQVAALNDAGINTLMGQLWLSGTVMLFDNAAAAAVGEWMSAEPTPDDYYSLIFQASDTFEAGYIYIEPGLDLIPNVVFEPRVAYDYLYGRMVSHVYQHPDVVAFGIQRDTALEISPSMAQVIGDNAAIVIDGRYAQIREEGSNGIMAATWLLLDTFVTGDVLSTNGYQLYLPIVIR